MGNCKYSSRQSVGAQIDTSPLGRAERKVAAQCRRGHARGHPQRLERVEEERLPLIESGGSLVRRRHKINKRGGELIAPPNSTTVFTGLFPPGCPAHT